MRTTREQKEKTGQRVLAGAARLIRERGIDAASVGDVMKAAGLTHGGFYRHFDGKEALVLAALEAAFAEQQASLEQRFDEHAPAEAAAGHRADYLQGGHVQTPGIGCPMPTLAGDVARGPQPLKAAFGAGVMRIVDALAQGMHGPAEQRRAAAIREVAMLAGAILLARASDPGTAEMILEACREPSRPNDRTA